MELATVVTSEKLWNYTLPHYTEQLQFECNKEEIDYLLLAMSAIQEKPFLG